MSGETKAVSVGSLKKGSYIILDGIASRVSDIQTSRPGKHGHAKCRIMAVGILDGRKREKVLPGHDDIEAPIIGKKSAQVLSIHSNIANVMDSETFETFDIKIPDELKEKVIDGVSILYWEILTDKIMVQVKSN